MTKLRAFFGPVVVNSRAYTASVLALALTTVILCGAGFVALLVLPLVALVVLGLNSARAQTINRPWCGRAATAGWCLMVTGWFAIAVSHGRWPEAELVPDVLGTLYVIGAVIWAYATIFLARNSFYS